MRVCLCMREFNKMDEGKLDQMSEVGLQKTNALMLLRLRSFLQRMICCCLIKKLKTIWTQCSGLTGGMHSRCL